MDATIIHYRRRPANFHDLATETLAQIFTLASSYSATPYDINLSWLDHYLSFHVSQIGLPTQICISQVCSRWRYVSVSLPWLWTSIVIKASARPNKDIRNRDSIAAFLERSKSLPLRIKINTSNVFEEEKSGEETDVDDEQNESDSVNVSDEVDLVKKSPLSKKNMRNMKLFCRQALELIVPLHKRLQSLSIVNTHPVFLEMLFKGLSGVDGAPLLEDMYFEGRGIKNHFKTSKIPYVENSRRIFQGDIPSLKSIKIEGTALRWEVLSPLKSYPPLDPSTSGVLPNPTPFRLTTLNILYPKLLDYDSMAHFLSLICAMPTLRSLALECDPQGFSGYDDYWDYGTFLGMGPELDLIPETVATADTLIAILPDLEELSLVCCFCEESYFRHIVSTLFAPSLRKISLNFQYSPPPSKHYYESDRKRVHDRVEEFIEAISSPFSVLPPEDHETCYPRGIGLLTSVECLELRGWAFPTTGLTQLIDALPALRVLKVNQQECITEVLLPFVLASEDALQLLEEIEIHEPAIPYISEVERMLAASLWGFMDSYEHKPEARGPLGRLIENQLCRKRPLQRLTVYGDADALKYFNVWAKLVVRDFRFVGSYELRRYRKDLEFARV